LDAKRILLIDKDNKKQNDRTWCFWSKEKETFDPILYKSWSNILYADAGFEKTFDINPYKYKMIRGIDFYNHVIPFLKSKENTDFTFEAIESITESKDIVSVKTDTKEYNAPHLFKSYYENLDFSNDLFVWQHFKGWLIKTETDCFDPDQAHFMDFRTDQKNETRFFYVLPHSKREALIEIAIFSGEIPDSKFYDPLIKDYIKNILKIEDYKILEEEVNAIPMTGYDFSKNEQKRIINIGTNAGSVKASSGFAFKRIQEETDRIVEHIKKDKLSSYRFKKTRFSFYDKIMLNAILTGKTNGETVFGQLFRKLSPQTIFKFLDEKGSFFHDLKVFTAPPTLPFTKAFFEEIRK